MQDVYLRTAVGISSSFLAIALYNMGTTFTKFPMDKWTKAQTGGLVGVVALNTFRPYIQERIDKKLGETPSKLFFDLTPFIVVGFTHLRANRLKMPALLAGGYFAVCNKIIDMYQHQMAWDCIWDGQLLPRQRATPQTYYEELALAEGNAAEARRAREYNKEKGDSIRALCLIRTGEVDRGTGLYTERLRSGHVKFRHEELLKAQVSYYISINNFPKASEAIQSMERTLAGEKHHVRFRCYREMIHAYAKMEKTVELEALLQRMEGELPRIEAEETNPLTHPWGVCYGYNHRQMIAEGYCYLPNQDQKILELVNAQQVQDLRYSKPEDHASVFHRLFREYIEQRLGKDCFDEDFASKIERSSEVKKVLEEKFNVETALRHIKLEDYDAAAPIAQKFMNEDSLKELAYAYNRKKQFAEAEDCAKKIEDRRVYEWIGRAYLNEGRHAEALEAAKELRDQNFLATVYLKCRTEDNPYDKELQEFLNQPKVRLTVKAEILHTLDGDLAVITNAPVSGDKVSAYLKLAELKQEDRYLDQAREMVDGRDGVDGFDVACAYLEKNQIQEAFELIRGMDLIIYELLAGIYLDMDGPHEYDYFQGLSQDEAFELRVRLAGVLQSSGKYANALAVLEPMYQ